MALATATEAPPRPGAAPPRKANGLATPIRLWLALAAAVVAVLVAGLATGLSAADRETSAAHTGQATEALYAEVQNLSYSLADANATAATALLIGPETPTDFTTRFDSDVTQAEDLLAAASQRVVGDSNASNELKSLAEQIPMYTGYVGQAMADNRFGYPVSGAYMREASSLLTGSMLPEIRAVISEQQNATTGGIDSASSTMIWALIFCVLAIAVVWRANEKVYGWSKRRLNPGLVLAILSVFALMALSVYGAGASAIDAKSANDAFTTVSNVQDNVSQLALAETYVALQQIDRGEDQGADAHAANTALVNANNDIIDDQAAPDTHDSNASNTDFATLDQCATHVIELANQGQYTQATTAMVGSGAQVGKGGCEPDAGALRNDMLNLFTTYQGTFDSRMTSLSGDYAGSLALPLGLIIALLGAFAAAWGLNRRLAEYR